MMELGISMDFVQLYYVTPKKLDEFHDFPKSIKKNGTFEIPHNMRYISRILYFLIEDEI